MYERKLPLPAKCGLHITREILYGKWKPHLILAISSGVKRPRDIQRIVPQATKRVLNIQLKELEYHGIICKEIFPQFPLKVEYSLTALGESLMPVIDAMSIWGDLHRELLEDKINGYQNDGILKPIPFRIDCISD